MGRSLLNLKDIEPSNIEWQQAIKNQIHSSSEVEKIHQNLLQEITDFFSRWYNTGKLSDYFSYPTQYVFDADVFNPNTHVNQTFPTNQDYGQAIGTFPLIGKIDIIDYKNQKLIKIIHHKDEWLKPKTPRTSISADTPLRREEIILEPAKIELWILRQAIATLPSRYWIGAQVGEEFFGEVPELYNPGSENWNKYYLGFQLKLETIEKTIPVIQDKTNQIVEGRINCYLAFKGNSYRIMSLYPRPCDDPLGFLDRDEYCDLINPCRRKSLASLFLTMNFELKRIEKKIFDERILNFDWKFYRLAELLPTDWGPLNNPFLEFWMGDIQNRNPLEIKLRYTFQKGLNLKERYRIFYWSTFFGPNSLYTLDEIVEVNGDDVILKFSENFPEIGYTGEKCVIYKKREEKYDLFKLEQEALFYHLTHRYEDDVSTPAGAAVILNKDLEKGGKRVGHATFGGWAQYL